jgi:hypothetical protein
VVVAVAFRSFVASEATVPVSVPSLIPLISLYSLHRKRRPGEETREGIKEGNDKVNEK